MATIHNKVMLYYNPRYVFVSFDNPSAPNWNLTMNETRFKIDRGTHNLVQFIVRDNDRKPINLLGKELHITVNNEDQIRTLIHKKLKVYDAPNGILHLELQPYETLDWPIGYLEFNISITEENRSRMISLDQAQTSRGFLEVVPGIYTGPRPSMETCSLVPVKVNDIPDQYRFYSDVFPGTLNTSNYQGLSTAAITTENYSGRMWVMGCMEQEIPQNRDSSWFVININDNNPNEPFLTFTSSTGITNVDFICRCYWIIFKFDPSIDTLLNPGEFSGIKKISYRN